MSWKQYKIYLKLRHLKYRCTVQEKYLPGRSELHPQAALQDRNPENGSDYIQNLFLVQGILKMGRGISLSKDVIVDDGTC